MKSEIHVTQTMGMDGKYSYRAFKVVNLTLNRKVCYGC